jgi:glycosyltransferase involved in cell wall biosynthesis
VNITVAICTWNQCESLRAALAQMTRLSVPSTIRWDLLVVDNNCTDGTTTMIDTFRGRLPVRVLSESRPGASHARNRALREAHGDFIVFTDDDVLVDEGWLAAFATATSRFPDAAAYGGPITPWFLTPPDPDLCAAFPSLASGFCGLEQPISAGPMTADAHLWGANMAFRRAAIAGLTFDPALGPSPTSLSRGEDVVFLSRLRARGGVAVWCPSMHVKHCVAPARMTLAYVTRFSFGKGREHVLERAPEPTPAPQLFSAPRWLWREWAVAACRDVASRCGCRIPFPSRLRSGPAPADGSSATMHRLVSIRERSYLGGMLRGFRERNRTNGR